MYGWGQCFRMMEPETHCKASLFWQAGLMLPVSDGSKIPPQKKAERIRSLRAASERARRLAKMTLDVQAAANLQNYAEGLEAEARKLEEQQKDVLTRKRWKRPGSRIPRTLWQL
jgi:hypothetical protein